MGPFMDGKDMYVHERNRKLSASSGDSFRYCSPIRHPDLPC